MQHMVSSATSHPRKAKMCGDDDHQWGEKEKGGTGEAQDHPRGGATLSDMIMVDESLYTCQSPVNPQPPQ